PERDASVPAEHGDDHCEPFRIDTGRNAPWHGEVARCDERLDLEQDRTRSFERARYRRADLASGGAAEHLRRIGHTDQPRARHLEYAELVRGAKPVLRRAQDAVRVVAVAFELQHAVHEMLE